MGLLSAFSKGATTAGGNYKLLATHQADATEASHSFTGLSVDLTQKHIVLFVSGVPSAQLALQLKINGTTSTYQDQITTIIGTTEAHTASTAQAEWTLAETTVLPGVNVRFFGEFHLYGNELSDRIGIHGNLTGMGTARQETSGFVNAGTLTVTSVDLETSTSTWTANTHFELYEVTV